MAANVHWTNPAGGNWSDPANWGGTAPALGDNVFIDLAGTYTVTLDVSPNLGSLTLGAASGTQTLSSDTQTMNLTASSQVGANGELVMINGTIIMSGGNRTFTNSGALWVFGTSSISSGGGVFFSNPIGAIIHIEGNTLDGAASLTINTGFTNAGMIELTNSAANQSAALNITNGTLTNTGTIDILAGAGGGGRTLDLALANQSTINVATAAALNSLHAATHTNSGIINLTANLDLNLAADTFTHTGTIAIGSGTTLNISGGTFNNNAGALLRLVVADVMVPIHDARARAVSRPAIDEFRFRSTFEILERMNNSAAARNELDFRYEGEGAVDGRATVILVRRLPYTGTGGLYPDAKVILHLDQE
jgi:hypothetical protein